MFNKLITCFLALALTFAGCSDDPTPDPVQDIPYPTEVQNRYPIILVHGMCGWGRDELLGKFRYWGGTGDIQEYLKSKGYEVYTASIGPLSSNWDRAVELYHCIKGGKVDYGAVHSGKYRHERYGREYPGLYPQWDENHPVHIIGHSMGGPTPRHLIELLENGDAQEQLFVPDDIEAPSSGLFDGGRKRWVYSHTTLSGAHNGTIVVDDALEFRQLVGNLFFHFAAVAGLSTTEWLYDFNLQQWGLERDKGESFENYWKRVQESEIWTTDDHCVYDLSVEASNYLNRFSTSSDNVYYASYTFDCTEPGNPQDIRVPIATTNPLVKAPAARMGANLLDLPLGFLEWRPNDGLLSAGSARYPFGHKYVMMDTGNRKLAPKGTWDVHPMTSGQDHLSIVMPDQKNTIDDLNAFYEKIAYDLWCLP